MTPDDLTQNNLDASGQVAQQNPPAPPPMAPTLPPDPLLNTQATVEQAATALPPTPPIAVDRETLAPQETSPDERFAIFRRSDDPRARWMREVERRIGLII